MHDSYFSGCIYVEKTSERCCLDYHNSQKAKEGVWRDKYSSNSSDDQQVENQDDQCGAERPSMNKGIGKTLEGTL